MPNKMFKGPDHKEIAIILGIALFALALILHYYAPLNFSDLEILKMIKSYGLLETLKIRFTSVNGIFNLHLGDEFWSISRSFNYASIINVIFLMLTVLLFQNGISKIKNNFIKVLIGLIVIALVVALIPLVHSLFVLGVNKYALYLSIAFIIISYVIVDLMLHTKRPIFLGLNFLCTLLTAGIDAGNFVYLIMGYIYLTWNHWDRMESDDRKALAIFNIFVLSQAALMVVMNNDITFLQSSQNVIPALHSINASKILTIAIGVYIYFTITPKMNLQVTHKQIGILGLVIVLAILAAAIFNSTTVTINNAIVTMILLFIILCSIAFYNSSDKKKSVAGPLLLTFLYALLVLTQRVNI